MNSYNFSSQNCTVNSLKEECDEFEETLKFIPSLSVEACDLQSLCRICLSSDCELFPLHITIDGSQLLSEMFTRFTDITVHPEDGLPLAVCEDCRSQVFICYNFKIKCMKSDNILKSFLKRKFGTKDVFDNDRLSGDENNEMKTEPLKLEPQDYGDEHDDEFSDSDNETLCILQKFSKKKSKELLKLLGNTDTKENACDTNFIRKSNKKSKSASFECDTCLERFESVKALNSHTKRCHSTTNLRKSSKRKIHGPSLSNSCKQCKESFDSEHDLMLHMTLHGEGPPWRCNECNKEFSVRFALRRHIYRHMEVKRYACEVCGKPFAEFYALRRHTRVHTGERTEKKHVCHICEKRFSESSQLAAHLSRHTGERRCVCTVCGKAFPTPRLLRSHCLVHTDSKPHACRYCDKRFRHESTRKTHHRTHTGERPYVCATCGKAFIQNSNLTLHMRTHTGEKPYKCDTCGQMFSTGSSLKSHVRRHTGERPYGCEVCGKKFARVMDLSSHHRSHSADRPHACAICRRTFSRAARLREHTRTHTGEKPFECTVCPQKFVTKSHLVKHTKTHQSKKKSSQVVVVQEADEKPTYIPQRTDVNAEDGTISIGDENSDGLNNGVSAQEITIDNSEVPLEISEELVLQDVNLVAVNEGGVSIAATSSMLESTTVKLYQLDQSLVEIHSIGGQVTISKITSKMTANF